MMEIITKDQRMLEIQELAKTVAQSKATVLIQGESGTGKELIANQIHSSSSRRDKPFIAINCAAIPESLLESELFGYERGAFTGAVNSRAGKFELANGGTLLLDEISEMDVRLQAKLLRVIQEGEVDRIGSKRSVAVDVRIIATTNRNLSECVKLGTFREDLYYRLNVVNLTLPALKERIGDVQILCEHFAEKFSSLNGKSPRQFHPDALRMMASYTWPGNVRELENVVERAVIVSADPIIQASEIKIEGARNQSMSSTLDASASPDSTAWEPGKTLDDIERDVIIKALEYHTGNRTHTARSLGISIRTLRNKISDYRKMGIYV